MAGPHQALVQKVERNRHIVLYVAIVARVSGVLLENLPPALHVSKAEALRPAATQLSSDKKNVTHLSLCWVGGAVGPTCLVICGILAAGCFPAAAPRQWRSRGARNVPNGRWRPELRPENHSEEDPEPVRVVQKSRREVSATFGLWGP